ncbi:MAG: hypothetical protein Q4G27_10165 [Flavobacteriaceae bacterium]|nr:hypothetical protein [Flavobacteriaceae bacterium]
MELNLFIFEIEKLTVMFKLLDNLFAGVLGLGYLLFLILFFGAIALIVGFGLLVFFSNTPEGYWENVSLATAVILIVYLIVRYYFKKIKIEFQEYENSTDPEIQRQMIESLDAIKHIKDPAVQQMREDYYKKHNIPLD